MTLRKQQSAYDSMHREDADASSGVAPQVKRTCPGITFVMPVFCCSEISDQKRRK